MHKWQHCSEEPHCESNETNFRVDRVGGSSDGHSAGPKDVTSADNRGGQTDSLTGVIVMPFSVSK